MDTSKLVILATAAETRLLVETGSFHRPITPPLSEGSKKCSYVESCSLKGKIFPLMASKFSQLEDVPEDYRLWCCNTHKVMLQKLKDPVSEWQFVQNQVDLLTTWGGVGDWVVKFRNGGECCLKREGMPTLRLGREEEVRSESDVWFIGLTGEELSFILNCIKENINTNKPGFRNVVFLPYQKNRYRESIWYRKFHKNRKHLTRRPMEGSGVAART
ncbi:MAG: hypothetical protein M1840_006317 [Geoglossum simile]|nr:MAG: hypothetical protein M1840_006317 [Geoglossum simile]